MTISPTGRADFLQEGDWNAQCALCGRKGKASEMKKLPQGVPGAGLYVHMEHNYNRNPQDFVRAVADDQVPPWTQPWTEAFTEPTYFLEEDGDATIATTAGITSILNIYEGVTVPTLTITGSGTLVINNYGVVQAVVNASATVELHNHGSYP